MCFENSLPKKSFNKRRKKYLNIIIFTLIVLFTIQFVSANYCYQGLPNNNSNGCGLNNGTYAGIIAPIGFIGNMNGEIYYHNYTIPINALNTSKIQIKQGTGRYYTGVATTNFSIPLNCFSSNNGILQLRFMGSEYGVNDVGCSAGIPCSFSQCFNGTSWEYYTPYYNTGEFGNFPASGYTITNSPNLSFDNDYSTYSFSAKSDEKFATNMSDNSRSLVLAFYELGIYWNMTPCIESWIQNDTICNNYNYTIIYYDNHTCGTYTDIPLNNGSVVNCVNLNNLNITFINPTNDTRPTISTVNTTIFFSWINSSLNSGIQLNYSIILYNGLNYYNILNQSYNLNYSWSTNKNYIPSGYYTARNIICNTTNCVYGVSNQFFLCENNFQQSPQPCVGGLKQIVYYDANDCDTFIVSDMPANNGSYTDCISYVYNKTVYDDDIIIIGLLIILLIVSLVCAISVHEGFFGLCALITGLLLATFITYDYPQILSYLMIFMILLFSIMWIIIYKHKR